MIRPKKVTIFEKKQIDELVRMLLKHKKLTLTNLCVIELRQSASREYFNVSKNKISKAPNYRVNIKKARYLKEEIQRQKASKR